MKGLTQRSASAYKWYKIYLVASPCELLWDTITYVNVVGCCLAPLCMLCCAVAISINWSMFLSVCSRVSL
ncbi:hypothetical protein Fmac_006086 [Flemingia macrophylla]|uniref:Uncharacterized protein n=1 Tax=Flemingia macrophylla TaxID=520843 RepID=A0ABD1N9M9_9FABA